MEGMYGGVEHGKDRKGNTTMRVMRAIDVKQTGEREITIEWMGGSTNDMVADSVLALLMGIDTSPASVKSELMPLYELCHFHVSHVQALMARPRPCSYRDDEAPCA